MYRLLLVDDEKMIVDSLYGYLSEHFDFEIYRTQSGKEALALLQKMSIDMVISDISMPQMDGLELLEIIGKMWPACRVMLLTAYNVFNYAYRAMRQGNVRYLLKIESYELIKENVQEMADEVTQERENNQRLIELNQKLLQKVSSINSYIVNRAVVQGISLPTQKELDSLGIPLRSASPALLAVGQIESYSVEKNHQAYEAITQYLQSELAPLNITVIFSYSSGSQGFWLMQENHGEQLQNKQVIYAKISESLGGLPRRVKETTGLPMAITLGEGFAPWEGLHSLYQRCKIQLKRMYDETGLIIVGVNGTEEENHMMNRFIDMEEIQLLWAMVENGERDEIIAFLEKRLSFIKQCSSLNTAFLQGAISPIRFFITEAARIYAPQEMSGSRMKGCLENQQLTGEAWLGEIFEIIQIILNLKKQGKENQWAWMIRAVNQYIEENYDKDITLTDLAAQVNYNPSYLSRSYKEHTNKNVMTYLKEVRLKKAKELLIHTNQRVGDIAKACGFCSTRYFNQSFKKALGITPNAFRQKDW